MPIQWRSDQQKQEPEGNDGGDGEGFVPSDSVAHETPEAIPAPIDYFNTPTSARIMAIQEQHEMLMGVGTTIAEMRSAVDKGGIEALARLVSDPEQLNGFRAIAQTKGIEALSMHFRGMYEQNRRQREGFEHLHARLTIRAQGGIVFTPVTFQTLIEEHGIAEGKDEAQEHPEAFK